MIRCLVVDDEAYAARLVADYISKIPYLSLEGSYANAIEALTRVQQGGIDLVFLDIQMPLLTGMQFLQLCQGRCKVVLITAYPEYALQGYEHDVIDYLLKPVAFERFLKAAQKAYTVLNQPAAEIPASNDTPAPGNAYMFVKGDSKNKFLKVNFDDILYIEGLKNYVSVFTAQQRIITYQALRELELQLPHPPFVRIHKSYLISIRHVRMVDGHQVYIGDQTLPVGETYRDAFYKMIRER